MMMRVRRRGMARRRRRRLMGSLLLLLVELLLSLLLLRCSLVCCRLLLCLLRCCFVSAFPPYSHARPCAIRFLLVRWCAALAAHGGCAALVRAVTSPPAGEARGGGRGGASLATKAKGSASKQQHTNTRATPLCSASRAVRSSDD